MQLGDTVPVLIDGQRHSARIVRILDRRGQPVRACAADAPYTMVVVVFEDGRAVSVPLWVPNFPVRLVTGLMEAA